MGRWVADDQLRSTRLSATQRNACSRRRPTPTGDGTTMRGGGRRRWTRARAQDVEGVICQFTFFTIVYTRDFNLSLGHEVVFIDVIA
jgi:hypothetical protein